MDTGTVPGLANYDVPLSLKQKTRAGVPTYTLLGLPGKGRFDHLNNGQTSDSRRMMQVPSQPWNPRPALPAGILDWASEFTKTSSLGRAEGGGLGGDLVPSAALQPKLM